MSRGFAALKDVEKKTKEDRMPSFFLAETLMYVCVTVSAIRDSRVSHVWLSVLAQAYPCRYGIGVIISEQ